MKAIVGSVVVPLFNPVKKWFRAPRTTPAIGDIIRHEVFHTELRNHPKTLFVRVRRIIGGLRELPRSTHCAKCAEIKIIVQDIEVEEFGECWVLKESA